MSGMAALASYGNDEWRVSPRTLAFLLLVAWVYAQALGGGRGESARRLYHYLTTPIRRPLLAARDAMAAAAEYAAGFESCRRRLHECKERLALLELELTRRRKLEEEVARLRELLRFTGTCKLPFTMKLCPVEGRSSGLYGSTYMLRGGASDGICVSSAVLSPKGVVGRIVEAYTDTSILLPLTHPESSIGVRFSASGMTADAEGDGDGTLLVKNLPEDFRTTPGEEVVTSGYSRIFPPGLPVGTVLTTTRDDKHLTPVVHVAPYVQARECTEVLVLIPTRRKEE